MDKNEKEKRLLYEWAVQNSASCHFQEIDITKASYFEERESNGNSYIGEYAFESLPEFMKELDALWGDDEVMKHIKKAVGIAAIKNKVSFDDLPDDDKNERKNTDHTEKLPMYIYNF